jgi:hypothetical protein
MQTSCATAVLHKIYLNSSDFMQQIVQIFNQHHTGSISCTTRIVAQHDWSWMGPFRLAFRVDFLRLQTEASLTASTSPGDVDGGWGSFLYAAGYFELFHPSQNAFKKGFSLCCSEVPLNTCSLFSSCHASHTRGLLLVERHSQSNCPLASPISPMREWAYPCALDTICSMNRTLIF